jgi:hypothetical protein
MSTDSQTMVVIADFVRHGATDACLMGVVAPRLDLGGAELRPEAEGPFGSGLTSTGHFLN